MKVLVSGSTGLVGSALCQQLGVAGHAVARLVRRDTVGGGDVHWDPAKATLGAEKLRDFDAVIHLAGENIAGQRWTQSFKEKIRDSRVNGTRLLAESLASLDRPPEVLLCASAIGYYGDRGSEVLTEQSEPGNDFLADVCRQWENAADPARERGVRVVHLRLGVVLSSRGGALAKMLLPFRMGAGGVVGTGAQYWSWVALDDVVGAFQHCVTAEGITGAVNCVTPNPSTNREFTKTLGRVLRRPTFMSMPAIAANLAFGEMARPLMLCSTRVRPEKLQQSGYEFRYPDLDSALRRAILDSQ